MKFSTSVWYLDSILFCVLEKWCIVVRYLEFFFGELVWKVDKIVGTWLIFGTDVWKVDMIVGTWLVFG